MDISATVNTNRIYDRFLSSGGASPTYAPPYPVSTSSSNFPYSIALSDLDNDGKLDVVGTVRCARLSCCACVRACIPVCVRVCACCCACVHSVPSPRRSARTVVKLALCVSPLGMLAVAMSDGMEFSHNNMCDVGTYGGATTGGPPCTL